jgi:hypothetical protein
MMQVTSRLWGGLLHLLSPREPSHCLPRSDGSTPSDALSPTPRDSAAPPPDQLDPNLFRRRSPYVARPNRVAICAGLLLTAPTAHHEPDQNTCRESEHVGQVRHRPR